MSTFGGIMKEFPFISIDRFDNENLNSQLFFLSHCHMDHMIGLSDGIPGPLYVSSISSIIIKKQFPHIKELVVLKENESTPIQYKDDNDIVKYVTVTTIPAFHCPGSVMFLFEEGNVKVLYTGDFRLSKRYLQKVKTLKNSVGSINTVYIDSTFLNKAYLNFPGQIRCATAICDIIKEWLSRCSRNVASLKMPARYGYELLFIEIGKRLKLKIHINESEMTKYRYIPELDSIFTTLPHKSRIHACFDYYNKNGKFLTCNPDLDPELIRVIKPTAMIWTEWEESLDFVKREPNENIRVCYSNHCSMTEIKDFLTFLQPKNVELNVVPADPIKKQKMIDELDEMMRQVHSKKCVTVHKIQQCNWDNLNQLSKINFKFSKQFEAKEQVVCPPKRRKM